MSQLQVNRINDASGGVLAPISSVMRNRIINGAMVIDQRNAGASVTPTADSYNLDRWFSLISQTSKFSVQQNAGSVTPPVGFTNYLGCTSLSAYSLVAGDYFTLRQAIEGFNVADLGWGTANAKTVTVSFWVRSSLTGTFGGSLQNNTSARSYPFTYTISAANTWEQKSVTIAGDTSGTWQTGNQTGIFVYFGLGVGSTFSGTAGAWAGTNFIGATGAVSVVGTNGATFYITGVQLEVGTQATGFEYRQYGTELNLCLRYAFVGTSDVLTTVFGTGATTAYAQIVLPVQMRASPTPTISGSLFVTANGASGGDITATSPTVSANGLSNIGGRMSIAGYNSALTNNSIYGGTAQGASGKITFSAEL